VSGPGIAALPGRLRCDVAEVVSVPGERVGGGAGPAAVGDPGRPGDDDCAGSPGCGSGPAPGSFSSRVAACRPGGRSSARPAFRVSVHRLRPAVPGPCGGPRGVIKIPLWALVATELLFPGRIARRARRAMPVPGAEPPAGVGGRAAVPVRRRVVRREVVRELSGLRTLAALTSRLGAKLGANSGRRRATSGHIGPRTPQVIGTQGAAAEYESLLNQST
jgi:hypothetical protein